MEGRKIINFFIRFLNKIDRDRVKHAMNNLYYVIDRYVIMFSSDNRIAHVLLFRETFLANRRFLKVKFRISSLHK